MSHQPLGPVRCPACGQKALPAQTRCLYCNARLNEAVLVEPVPDDAIQAVPPIPFQLDEAVLVEPVPDDAIQAVPPIPFQLADGKCPGCGKELPPEAVLCIECGYDLRTGRKRQTVHALAEEEEEAAAPRRKRKGRPEPLPAGLGKVQLGLGFHYARLVLTLLAVLGIMGLLAYGMTFKLKAEDPGLLIGGLVALGIVLLAAVLGLAGSVLCLGVGRPSRAWGFIFTSLVLDVLTVPLVVYQQIAAFPPFLGWGIEFVSWIFFMLFLRRLAVYVDRPGEANELMALITLGVALLVGVPLLLILLAHVAFLSALQSVAMAGLILGVSVLISVVQLIFLIRLFFSILGNIQTIREAIASRLPEREREQDAQPASISSGE